ncbi:MAG: transposase [Candidatus Hydrogenedens sp.]|nr:transposase [Candidatus Hydrogenedens sp.]
MVDSLSFREFLGIGFDGVVPDETTLCRFRGLEKNGAYHFLLMAEYN